MPGFQERRQDYPNIFEAIGELKEATKKTGDAVSRIEIILKGNGKKGIVALVLDHDDYFQGHRKMWGTVKTSIVVSLCIGALAFVMACFRIPINITH